MPFLRDEMREKGFLFLKVVIKMRDRFEEMVKKLSPTLRGIAHKLNGRFTFFDEDDLFQEALAHLWTAFREEKLADKTDSYILQGCYFYLKNRIRTLIDKASLTSLNELFEEGNSTIEKFLEAKGPAPEDEIDSHLVAEAASADGLSKREREVLSLSFDGLTVREIGSRLGISHVMVIKIRKNIKSKASRLRKAAGYNN